MPLHNFENRRFSGSEPGVGTFDCRVDSTGDDWCIFIVATEGQRIERYCSTWQNEPCHGLTHVYEILREYGFTVGGKSSAEDDLERLIEHCAVLGTEWPDCGDLCDMKNESWRSLPDHLQKAITKAEEALPHD